jgi:hypothetical protein
VSFQKRLLRGMEIGAVKGGAACHAAHAEHVHLLPVAGKLRVGFVPDGMSRDLTTWETVRRQ